MSEPYATIVVITLTVSVLTLMVSITVFCVLALIMWIRENFL